MTKSRVAAEEMRQMKFGPVAQLEEHRVWMTEPNRKDICGYNSVVTREDMRTRKKYRRRSMRRSLVRFRLGPSIWFPSRSEVSSQAFELVEPRHELLRRETATRGCG